MSKERERRYKKWRGRGKIGRGRRKDREKIGSREER